MESSPHGKGTGMTFDEWIKNSIFTQQFRTKEEWMRLVWNAGQREALLEAVQIARNEYEAGDVLEKLIKRAKELE